MDFSRPPTTPVNVLLIEDNPGDVELTRLSLAETQLQHRLHVAEDGDQALAFLKRQAPYEAAPRPDLTLLDLNLPRRDGRAVLAEIKTDGEPEGHARGRPDDVQLSARHPGRIQAAREQLHHQAHRHRPVGRTLPLDPQLLVQGCEAAAGGGRPLRE